MFFQPLTTFLLDKSNNSTRCNNKIIPNPRKIKENKLFPGKSNVTQADYQRNTNRKIALKKRLRCQQKKKYNQKTLSGNKKQMICNDKLSKKSKKRNQNKRSCNRSINKENNDESYLESSEEDKTTKKRRTSS
tara:strand:- start:4589 stop:4987 length:399 start_codon:yes stop_codon:yes gene_type:complete